MRELMRTNDVVFISFVESVLADNNISCAVLDQNMSVLDGSINMLPRRVMVDDDDHQQAVRAIREAGFSLDGQQLNVRPAGDV